MVCLMETMPKGCLFHTFYVVHSRILSPIYNLNCTTRSQPVACTSNIGDMDNQLGSILADLKAAKESKFLISFDTRSHIFEVENASESVP